MTYACSPSLNLFSERYHHANLARPMAAGEPVVVTARVEPLQKPSRGFTQGFVLSFGKVSHDEEHTEGSMSCVTRVLTGPPKCL